MQAAQSRFAANSAGCQISCADWRYRPAWSRVIGARRPLNLASFGGEQRRRVVVSFSGEEYRRIWPRLGTQANKHEALVLPRRRGSPGIR
jgi:hypothetical protein